MAEKKGGATDSIPEIDATMKPIMAQPGVEGYLLMNESAIPLKWAGISGAVATAANPIPSRLVHYSALIKDLTDKASLTARRLLGEGEELQLIRLRTKHNEMMIAPHEECTLTLFQAAHSSPRRPRRRRRTVPSKE